MVGLDAGIRQPIQMNKRKYDHCDAQAGMWEKPAIQAECMRVWRMLEITLAPAIMVLASAALWKGTTDKQVFEPVN